MLIGFLVHRSLSAGCEGYKEAPRRSAPWARCRVAMRTAAEYNYSSWKFEARALYRVALVHHARRIYERMVAGVFEAWQAHVEALGEQEPPEDPAGGPA